MAESEKKVYLELMRIIACFLVIVNHTNSGIFLNEIPGTKLWIVSILYFFVCKIAVPVFIMISGTLLLGKTDTYTKTGKRFLRIVEVLAVFSLVYYIRGCFVENTLFSPVEFIFTIWNRNITNAYWYLYVYLGLLAFLPIFQRMAERMKKKDYLYYSGLIFVVGGGYTIIMHYAPQWAYSGYFSLVIPSAYIGIFFLGYYMDHYVELSVKGMIISALLFWGMIIVQICLTLNEYKMTPDNYLFYDNCTFFPCVAASCCAFYFLKCLGTKITGLRLQKIIRAMGKATFGIFLLSDFFILVWGNTYGKLRSAMHPMAAVLIYEILIFVSGGVVTAALLKIPGIKKLL